MTLVGLQLALVLALAAPPTPGGSKSAIDAALDRLYPTTRDLPFGMQPEPGEKEPPLAQVVAYRAKVPVPHWHYVTYGLTELGEKVSTDATLSGFGVEYTLRLVDESEQPPLWPIHLLRYLAKVTWESSHPYDPGHSMNLPTSMLEEYSKGVEGRGNHWRSPNRASRAAHRELRRRAGAACPGTDLPAPPSGHRATSPPRSSRHTATTPAPRTRSARFPAGRSP